MVGTSVDQVGTPAGHHRDSRRGPEQQDTRPAQAPAPPPREVAQLRTHTMHDMNTGHDFPFEVHG